MDGLPRLTIDELRPTRDYLREVALVLSSLQRGFLEKQPRSWQYGLEISLRGLATQEFKIGGQPTRAILDFVTYKVRLGDNKWALHEFAAPEILQDMKAWLASQNEDVTLDEPTFMAGVAIFDTAQLDAYGAALWWLDEQFRILKANLHEGVIAPILLYPHHFDLSLVWFPYDDERQLAIGWSTGDEHIAEPYIYLTAYPEPAGFTTLALPAGAYWQTEGFSGAILPYAVLQASDQPAAFFQRFAAETLQAARELI